MEAVCSSETLVSTYKSTRVSTQKTNIDGNRIYQYCCIPLSSLLFLRNSNVCDKFCAHTEQRAKLQSYIRVLCLSQ
jgi:hypothetical protein